MIRHLMLGLLVATTLSACRLPGEGQPPSRVATVRGTPVPQRLYDTLLSISKHRAETSGAAIDVNQAAGARRLAGAEAASLRTAVRDTAFQELASARGIKVSDADIEQTLTQVNQALSGVGSLDGQLSQAGMTRDDFRLLTRYRILERRLRAADPRLDQSVEKLLAGDGVQIYADPCGQDHRYPQCLDAATR